METEDKNSTKKWDAYDNRSGRALGGLVVVIVGGIWLAHELGADIPYWVFTWPMFLIGVGIFVGAKHSFRGFGWLIPIAVGSIFLVNDVMGLPLGQLFWPIVIISAGLLMIFKPRNRGRDRWKERWNRDHYMRAENTSEDFLDSVSVFGNVKKNVISKDFKGGDLVCVFGGAELNLTQADINGKIVVELTMVFGGAKLIVPANWQVQSSELVSIFGGVEDKRPIHSNTTIEPGKTLILKGTCLFGGIAINSY